MCGIFGIYNFHSGRKFDETIATNAIDTLSHRGPDARGERVFGDNCLLGHRRLSIIDLSDESNQPFNIDNRFWIVYNGEIFNYIEIRKELIDKHSIVFKTNSDTEVLLRSYQVWGPDCVNHFNGMWAFAIFDNQNNNLFCSRDRFGIKPFNYAMVNDQLIFASEIKAILEYFPELKKPNYNVIANFCRFSVGAQHEETWFEGIHRLMPAHNMFVSGGKTEFYNYWNYPVKSDKTITFENAKEEYRSLFIDSIKLRMRSDVPVGTTLSSGVDSNSILFSLQQFNSAEHHTYTADFEPDKFDALDKSSYKNSSVAIDEAFVVRSVTKDLNLNQRFVKINYDNFIEDLERIIYHLESGNSSPAVIPSMQLLEVAKKEVDVVLEGQGADELLAGYHQSLMVNGIIEYLKSFRILGAFRTLKKSKNVYSLFYALLLYLRQQSNKFNIISIINQKFSNVSDLYTDKLKLKRRLKDYSDKNEPIFDSNFNKILYRQHKGGLVNLLHYGDAISMANSIEARLPFMDYRLVEYVFKLPWDYKFHEEFGKYIHRQAMQGICPDIILNNTVKLGFNTPLSRLFKSNCDIIPKPIDILTSEKCLNRGLFKTDKLLKLFELHDSGKKNYSTLLYRLLCTELWFRKFID